MAAGFGEKVSLVSPFQRFAMDVGQPYILEEQNNEEVHIPNNFSFRDISIQRNREQNLNYLKVMDVILKPGDCIYIPAYWWYQV